MKFCISPPQNQEPGREGYIFSNWNNGLMQTLTIVLSVGLYVGGFFLWPVKPEIKQIVLHPALYAGGFLLALGLTIFVHELLHLAAAPSGLSAADAVIGFNPRNFTFYSSISAKTNQKRTLLIF